MVKKTYSCQEQGVEYRRPVLISKSTFSVINKVTLCTQILHIWCCFSICMESLAPCKLSLVLRTPFSKLSQLADTVVGTCGKVYSLKIYN